MKLSGLPYRYDTNRDGEAYALQTEGPPTPASRSFIRNSIVLGEPLDLVESFPCFAPPIPIRFSCRHDPFVALERYSSKKRMSKTSKVTLHK